MSVKSLRGNNQVIYIIKGEGEGGGQKHLLTSYQFNPISRSPDKPAGILELPMKIIEGLPNVTKDTKKICSYMPNIFFYPLSGLTLKCPFT